MPRKSEATKLAEAHEELASGKATVAKVAHDLRPNNAPGVQDPSAYAAKARATFQTTETAGPAYFDKNRAAAVNDLDLARSGNLPDHVRKYAEGDTGYAASALREIQKRADMPSEKKAPKAEAPKPEPKDEPKPEAKAPAKKSR